MAKKIYPKVDMTGGSSRFPDMEEEVQKYWKQDDTFQASLEKTKDAQNTSSMMALPLLMACRTMVTC